MANNLKLQTLMEFLNSNLSLADDNKVRNSQLQKLNECIDLTTKHIVSGDSGTSHRDLNSFYLVFIRLADLLFGDSVTLAQILKPSETTVKPSLNEIQSPPILQATAVNDRSSLSNSRGVISDNSNSSFRNSVAAVPKESKNTTNLPANVKLLPSSGDWLRQLVYNVGTSDQNGLPRSSASMSPATIEFLAIFLPNSTMFDVLSRMQGGVDMRVQLLSQKSQMFLCLHAMFRYLHPVNSLSLLRLLTRDTCFHLHNQNVAKQEQRKSFQLSAIEYFIVCLLRYPTVSPANSLAVKNIDGFESLSADAVGTWVQSSPYFYLLSKYLNHYLCRSDVGNGGGGVSYGARDSAMAEFFIRIAIDAWIDTVPVVRVNHGQFLTEKATSTGNSNSLSPKPRVQSSEVQYHPKPTEIVTLSVSATKWTPLAMKSVYVLLQSLLSANNLAVQFRDSQAYFPQIVSDRLRGHECVPSEFDFAAAAHDFSYSILNSSPQAYYITMLQLPIFDMLRFIFTNYCKNSGNSKHGLSFFSTDGDDLDSTTVLLATDIWLLLLQPWTASYLGSATDTHPNNLSIWRPYIAANLHFYTTIWACYMNMAAGINFTQASSKRHLQYLHKVLTLFSSSELLSTVDDLNGKFKFWYCRNNIDRRDYIDESRALRQRNLLDNAASSAPELYAMAVQHQSFLLDRTVDKLIPDCGICDVRVYALEGCSHVVYSLEKFKRSLISFTSASKVEGALSTLDKIAESVLRVVGLNEISIGEAAAKGAAAGSHTLSDSAKVIKVLDACMEALHAIIPQADRGRSLLSSNDRNGSAEEIERRKHVEARRREEEEAQKQRDMRDERTGKLTDYGRRQLLLGREKCSLEIRNPEKRQRIPFCYYADPLDLPICSFESPMLLKVMTSWSKRLNKSYHLPKNDQWVMWDWIHLLELGKDRDYRLEEGLLRRQDISLAYVLFPVLCCCYGLFSQFIIFSEPAPSMLTTLLYATCTTVICGAAVAAYQMGFKPFHDDVVKRLPILNFLTINFSFLGEIFRFNLRMFSRVRIAAVVLILGTYCASQLFSLVHPVPTMSSVVVSLSFYIISLMFAFWDRSSY